MLPRKNILNKFKDIDILINNIDLFDQYNLKCVSPNKNNNKNNKNQLFSKNPPYELVVKILNILLNREISNDIHYEFSKNSIKNKNINNKIKEFIPELKIYYLKCKHQKYLENLNEKKIITLFRQILKPYDFIINSLEKYNNGEKYLLYTIEKKKNLILKKIDSFINFD